jgi:hypothetical protein
VQSDRLQLKVLYDAEKIRFACWMTKARILAHPIIFNNLLLFLRNSGYANAP